MPHIRPSVDDGSQRELTSNVVTDGRHIFSVPFWAPRSAVPSLHVVSDIGHLSAPCVMVALAGIVHDREAAAGHEHNRAEDNQQGGVHVDDLRCCGPPAYWPLNYPDSNERTMNAPEPSHRPNACSYWPQWPWRPIVTNPDRVPRRRRHSTRPSVRLHSHDTRPRFFSWNTRPAQARGIHGATRNAESRWASSWPSS